MFRHLPLSDVHPNAALAAEAAEAAGAQGKFWEMHYSNFARQDALQLADLLRYAGELGLDAETFEEDLRSGKHAARVGKDVNSAGEAGVAGTPSFFINEVRYRGAYELESLAAAVSQAGSMVENRARAATERD